MKSRWCRLYSELLDDPKIAKLDHETFHFFINLLCIATEQANSGIIEMDENELAWRMRFRKKSTARAIKLLCSEKILENGGKSFRIINWCKRQFASDDTTRRVADWRAKNKVEIELHNTANETLHETTTLCITDTDTDTDTELKTLSAFSNAVEVEEEFYLTKKKRKLKGAKLQSFMRFWKAFAYPKGKAEAADAWLSIPALTEPLVQKIIEAAQGEAIARPSIIEQGRTPKMAQGWISSRRWEDEIVDTSKTLSWAEKRKLRGLE